DHIDILWEIVKNARALSPLDSNSDSACKYAQRIHEVLVYVKETCPCLSKPSENLVTISPLNKDKKVRFAEPLTSSSNTHRHVVFHKIQDFNKPLLHSTGVICSTDASGSKPTCNTKNNRISQSSSSNKTNKVEDQSRSVKSRKNKKNRVVKTECNDHVMQSMLNANSKSTFAICNECLFDANHDKYVLDYVHDVNVLSKSKHARHGNKFPLTRFTSTKVVPLKETTIKSVLTLTQGIKVVQIVLWYLDSGCSKHITINRSQLTNFVKKFLGTVKFGNNQIANIMGLRHNLFSVGQLCDSDLDVAFSKHTCFVRNLEVPEVADLVLAISTGSPSSTSIDQDAPSPSTSQTPRESPSHVIPLGAKEADHDIEIAHMDNHPYVGILIPSPSSKESSSQVVIPNNVHSLNQPAKHISKWTKDHPIDNVIGDPSRPVSTRHQLQTEALFCYFDAFLSSVKPKSYKEALTESCWIEDMHEELNEFEHLEVWELVPHPNRVMIITLKWIYKVKLDELGGVLKNKARLVARGYHQEKGIEFEESFAPVT
ncbi:retrovirus-related pol polyprotein from transposon TNT 1-94, partial [Tanacetum coccineum]